MVSRSWPRCRRSADCWCYSAGRCPFGLCILCPITVNIWLFHVLFHATAPSCIVAPILVTLFEIVLLYAYRESFAGIWTTKAKPTL